MSDHTSPPPPPPLPGAAPPAEPLPTSAGLSFRCKSCGAQLAWDPESDALKCEYCGSATPVPRAEGAIVERPLERAAEAERGLGLPMRASRCGNCGATVALGETETAARCVFCGSPNVLPQAANRACIRPESLIPLDVGRAQAEAAFRRWIGSRWFRPNALKNTKTFQAVGVYVPYWTFDCEVHSKWSADAGYYYYVTVPTPVMVNGKMTIQMRQERRVRWEPAWGEREDAFDDVLILASKGISQELARELGGFELRQALVPYRPEYLAGWRAEEYQIDLEQGWEGAKAVVVAKQESRCSGDVPGDTQRNLNVHNTIADIRWKHVLLPVWSLSYQFNGRSFPVLINGQSGQISGKAPISWVKVLLLIVAILFAALCALVLANA